MEGSEIVPGSKIFRDITQPPNNLVKDTSLKQKFFFTFVYFYL